MTNNIILILLAVIAQLTVASACLIQGTYSGVCSYKYTTSSQATLEQIESAKIRWESDLPFCGKFVHYYPTCVPAASSSRSYDDIPNFLVSSDDNADVVSIREKDEWVEETVTNTIATRIEQEKSLGTAHYFRNQDCQDAYAAFSCWLNFPRCDDFQESLPLCQSACENMFRACGFKSDLWRCDEDIVDGEDEWSVKAFFPGQPFRRNEFGRGGHPEAVCTPSIKGSANDVFGSSFAIKVGIALAILLSFW